MKYLVAILLTVILSCDVYRVGLSLGPGLSVKNAVLYMAAMAFVLRMVVQGGFKFTLPRLHGAFALLIGYALISLLLLVWVFKVSDYRVMASVIALKSNLIDHFLFFAVCYYGAQTTHDALMMLRTLMCIVVAASVITVVNATGIATIGVMEIGRNGRVEGALGEPNQYAAFLATMLPPLVAALASTGRPIGKLFWGGGILLSLVAMVMTVSRGGVVALLLASVWGVFHFRRHLPLRKVMVMGVLCVIAVVILAALTGNYAEMLQERLIGQTFVNTGGDATSGRSQIWETAFTRMMDSPWSLFTGFGWFAYESMGFRFITHNSYLLLWFNLGLVGLIAFIVILAQIFRTTCKAVLVASPQVRPHLMGVAVGLIALAISILFVNLFGAWSYIWALLGLGTRLAVNELAVSKRVQSVDAEASTIAGKSRREVRFGWRAAENHPAR